LPGKNIVELCGRPLISYSIEAGLQSGIFEKVYVSTDNDEIARIARAYGADVPYKRPENLSNDAAGVIDVCLDLVRLLEEKGETFDSLCCLYPTAALRNADDILGSHEVFKDEYDSVIAVTRYFFPSHQALVANEKGRMSLYLPEIGKLKSQEVPDFWVDNGSIYWITIDALKKEQSFYTRNMGSFKMPKNRSIDVDTAEDLDMLRLLVKALA